MADHQREFERLSNMLPELTEETLMGTFIGGLKAQIQVEVLACKPDNLLEAFDEAKVAEQSLSFTSSLMYD